MHGIGISISGREVARGLLGEISRQPVVALPDDKVGGIGAIDHVNAKDVATALLLDALVDTLRARSFNAHADAGIASLKGLGEALRHGDIHGRVEGTAPLKSWLLDNRFLCRRHLLCPQRVVHRLSCHSTGGECPPSRHGGAGCQRAKRGPHAAIPLPFSAANLAPPRSRGLQGHWPRMGPPPKHCGAGNTELDSRTWRRRKRCESGYCPSTAVIASARNPQGLRPFSRTFLAWALCAAPSPFSFSLSASAGLERPGARPEVLDQHLQGARSIAVAVASTGLLSAKSRGRVAVQRSVAITTSAPSVT